MRATSWQRGLAMGALVLGLATAAAGSARADILPDDQPRGEPAVPTRAPPPKAQHGTSCFVGDSAAEGIVILLAIAGAAALGIRRKRVTRTPAALASA